MRSFRLLLAISALLAAVPSASANTTNFALNGTLLNGTFTGIVSFDTTTGDVVDSNFNVSADGVFDTYTGLPDTIYSSMSFMGFSFAGSAGNEFFLALPTPTLIGYTGGPLCSISSLCGDDNFLAISTAFEVDPTTTDFAVDGQLDPQLTSTQTPEPGSLPLLATGLLGVVAHLRHKFRQRTGAETGS